MDIENTDSLLRLNTSFQPGIVKVKELYDVAVTKINPTDGGDPSNPAYLSDVQAKSGAFSSLVSLTSSLIKGWKDICLSIIRNLVG